MIRFLVFILFFIVLAYCSHGEYEVPKYSSGFHPTPDKDYEEFRRERLKENEQELLLDGIVSPKNSED